jgi:DNA-directed RNA polymerase specialized sigma24 family protein
MTKSEFEFAAEQIDAFKERLSKEHFNILKAAAAASWSTRTIATNLSIPLGTVKSRLYRARRALCELIERQREQER